MERNEMLKIVTFFSKHKDIFINNEAVKSDYKIIIETLVANDFPNNFKLRNESKDLFIDYFLNNHEVFNQYTPKFITENEKCIKSSIKENINSAEYIDNINFKTKLFLIDEAVAQDVVLNNNSFQFLKSSYKVSLNSIKIDPQSLDFVIFDFMKLSEAESLKNTALKNGYTITDNTNKNLIKSFY